VIFSLLTSAFDEGLGAWYGEHKPSKDQKATDVLKEFPRPLLSCVAINWIMATAGLGFHNPMRSFSFRDLLYQLAAKDLAEGGNAILSQNMKNSEEHIARWNELQAKPPGSSARRRPRPSENPPIFFPSKPQQL